MYSIYLANAVALLYTERYVFQDFSPGCFWTVIDVWQQWVDNPKPSVQQYLQYKADLVFLSLCDSCKHEFYDLLPLIEIQYKYKLIYFSSYHLNIQ